MGLGPCLPPSPHIGSQCRLPPPPLQSRFHHDLTDTINQYNTSLNEQHPVKTILSINFRKTIVSAAVSARKSLRAPTGCSPPPSCLSACLSACPIVPPTQPRNPSEAKTTLLDKKTAFPTAEPIPGARCSTPSASSTQRANHPETHRPRIPPSALPAASNSYSRRNPSSPGPVQSRVRCREACHVPLPP